MGESTPTDLEAGFAQIWQPPAGVEVIALHPTIIQPTLHPNHIHPVFCGHTIIYVVIYGGEMQINSSEDIFPFLKQFCKILHQNFTVIQYLKMAVLDSERTKLSGLAGSVYCCYYTCFHSCTDLGCGRLSKLS